MIQWVQEMHRRIAATKADSQHLADHLTAVQAKIRHAENAQHKSRYAATEGMLSVSCQCILPMKQIT